MFDKFVGSGFLSRNKRLARRNSAAMLDALEAISIVAPKECAVAKVTLDPLRKMSFRSDNTLSVGSFTGVALSNVLYNGDDESSDIDCWFLIFNVRRYFSETIIWDASTPESSKASTQKIEYPEGKISREIRYARDGLTNKKVERLLFEKALREGFERKSRWTAPDRILVAEFNPSFELGFREDRSVVRTFGAELYRNMYNTLVAMEEALDSDVSDEELAAFINKKNTNPRFLLNRNQPVVESVNQFCQWY